LSGIGRGGKDIRGIAEKNWGGSKLNKNSGSSGERKLEWEWGVRPLALTRVKWAGEICANSTLSERKENPSNKRGHLG